MELKVKTPPWDIYGLVFGHPTIEESSSNSIDEVFDELGFMNRKPPLCELRNEEHRNYLSSIYGASGINLGIILIALAVAMIVFFALEKLAIMDKFKWITLMYSDHLNEAPVTTNNDPSISSWSRIYHRISKTVKIPIDELGWDGACFLTLYKLIIYITIGIAFLSGLLLFFNHQEGSQSAIWSLSFSNLDETVTNSDMAHSIYNLVAFIAVCVVFYLHFWLGDANSLKSISTRKLLVIWDIQVWSMAEKDIFKWIAKQFPLCETIHLRSKKTGGNIILKDGTTFIPKETVILLEFSTDDAALSTLKHHKESRRNCFKIKKIDTISIEDFVVHKFVYRIDHPWKYWSKVVLLYVVIPICIFVPTGLIIINPYVRLAIFYISSYILTFIEDIVGRDHHSKRHLGYLLTNVAFNLIFNLTFLLLHTENGIQFIAWLKDDQFFWYRIQCMFRPSLAPQLVNYIVFISFLRSAFSILRLSLIGQLVWFHLTTKIIKLWKNKFSPEVKETNAEKVRWVDTAEFDLGTCYGELITHFTITIVAGTTMNPAIVYPISLVILTVGYYVAKHDLVHTFRPTKQDPIIHKLAIWLSLLPFIVTALILAVYNIWRNQMKGHVVSMASSVISYTSSALIPLICIVILCFILRDSKNNKKGINRMEV